MMMNFLDLGAASEEERRIIREILSDTSVVNIAEPNKNLQHQQQPQLSQQQQQQNHQQQLQQSPQTQPPQLTNNNPQPNHHQQQSQLLNSQRQSYKISQNHQKNFSNSSNNSNYSTNNSTSANVITQNHRNNNYNNQSRKNIHNNSNNINSINISSSNSGSNSNNSGSNPKNSNKLSNLNNIAGGVTNNVQQQHYPQQYTPPLPSNVSPQSHYHNSHGANALSSQLNTRTSKQNSNDRLRNSGLSNHNINNNINSNSNNHNDINIVANSASGPATLAPNLDQLHGSTMSSNVYSHHATHTNQVPPVMPTAKLDPKNCGNSISLKSQSYHPQDTSNSTQNSNSGPQSVPSSAQMPPMPSDINTVIGMDMTSTQPSGYAIPQHVTAYGPPPHHVYGGPPIFQPYHYLIHPHYANLPSYMPYVITQNSVVPPSRQQVPPQSNQPPNTSTTTTTPSRSHSYHMSHQHNHNYNSLTTSSSSHSKSSKEIQLKNSPPSLDQDYSTKTSSSEKDLADECDKSINEPIASTKTSTIIDTTAITPTMNNTPTPTTSVTSTSNAITTPPPPPSSSSSSPSSSVIAVNITNTATSLQRNENISSSIMSSPEKATIISGDESESNSNLEPKTHSQQLNIVSNEKPAKTLSTSSSKSNGVLRKSPPSVATNTSRPLESIRPPQEKDSQETTETVDSKKSEPSQRNSGVAWGSAASKSWADLFKSEASALQHSSINGEIEPRHCGSESSDEEHRDKRSLSKMEDTVKNSSISSLKENRSQEAAKRSMDKMASKLAQKINSINLKHSLPFLKPRGFINKGNGCYINATLQALIACPPFYNLMKEIGVWTREDSCTPILDSFAELFLNFPPLDSSKKNKQSTPQDQKININYLQADAIEPKCIYSVLGHIKSECLKGAQEDAEEFLSSVLNGLHEEMVGLGEIIQESSAQNGHRSDIEDSNDDIANDDNLWREVGPKNRSLPIRTAKVINTPIQEIFGGSLFSIRTAGKDRCGHRSPFFSLQLDISGDNVKSVQDAIKSFTATEVIHDFYCSKTKQKIDAQRRTSLDQLPPILILHLKQFVYTQDYGLKKLMKTIEYPIDFELPENCLHEKTSADRSLRTSRSYKLLAVVYHDGKEAIKGHYLTDVYHIGSSQWIRCDDSNLKVIPAPRIENPDSSRTPYLLFYRRLNTLRAQAGNHDNKKKS